MRKDIPIWRSLQYKRIEPVCTKRYDLSEEAVHIGLAEKQPTSNEVQFQLVIALAVLFVLFKARAV